VLLALAPGEGIGSGLGQELHGEALDLETAEGRTGQRAFAHRTRN
jgi:hypothetical protein